MANFVLHQCLILRNSQTLPLVQSCSGVQHPRAFKLTYLKIGTYGNMLYPLYETFTNSSSRQRKFPGCIAAT